MALGCGPRRLPLTYAPFRLSPMNPQDLAKRQAAEAALAYVEPGEVLGVGTGSTVNLFIDLLAEKRLVHDIKGAVSSSNASSERLKKNGITVFDLKATGELSIRSEEHTSEPQSLMRI